MANLPDLIKGVKNASFDFVMCRMEGSFETFFDYLLEFNKDTLLGYIVAVFVRDGDEGLNQLVVLGEHSLDDEKLTKIFMETISFLLSEFPEFKTDVEIILTNFEKLQKKSVNKRNKLDICAELSYGTSVHSDFVEDDGSN